MGRNDGAGNGEAQAGALHGGAMTGPAVKLLKNSFAFALSNSSTRIFDGYPQFACIPSYRYGCCTTSVVTRIFQKVQHNSFYPTSI